MRIEWDDEYDILYIELRPNDVDETVDLANGVHLDLDAEDRVVGLEFLSLEAFDHFIESHNIPANPIDWLRNEHELRQILSGPRS
jgi:uncharacterized protein YuzE